MACYMEHCSTIVQLMNISFFPLRTDVKDEKPDLKRETKDDPDSSDDQSDDERTGVEDADIRDVRYKLERLVFLMARTVTWGIGVPRSDSCLPATS